MKLTRKKKFKKRNQLSFLESELSRIVFSESMSIFNTIANTEIKTGEDVQPFWRSKVSELSKRSLKAVREEYKHYTNYAFADEELYRKQLKRRHSVYLSVMNSLKEIERIERQLLLDKYSARLDKRLLKKYFKVAEFEENDFCGFENFFNAYAALDNAKVVKPIENIEAVNPEKVLAEKMLNLKTDEKEKDVSAEKEDKKTEDVKVDAKDLKKEKKSEKKTESKTDGFDVPPGQMNMLNGLNSSLKAQ